MAVEYKKNIIYEQLKREILDGTLAPGDRLPCEKDLARSFGIGQVTLRSALARLEAENLMERIPGKGTFIAKPRKANVFLLVLPDDVENRESPSRYIAAGVESAAREKGIVIERCYTSFLTNFSLPECRRMISVNRISGIILETGHAEISGDIIDRLKELRLPVVIPHGLIGDSERTGFLVQRTDERSAFADGLRYLGRVGHRNVATLFLNISSEKLSTVRGFTLSELVEFYTYNHFAIGQDFIKIVSVNPEEVRAAVRQWMLGPNPPTAIMCHSDRVAMRVYQVLHELNIRIPQQVSVMGYNNYLGSQLLVPSLTTIDIRLNLCGRMALEKLSDHKNWYTAGETPDEILTPYEIIERNSVRKLNL